MPDLAVAGGCGFRPLGVTRAHQLPDSIGASMSSRDLLRLGDESIWIVPLQSGWCKGGSASTSKHRIGGTNLDQPDLMCSGDRRLIGVVPAVLADLTVPPDLSTFGEQACSLHFSRQAHHGDHNGS